jgi:hypothetical protein
MWPLNIVRMCVIENFTTASASAQKKFDIFLIKNCNILIQATGEALSPQREHPALKNMKLLNLSMFLWVIFALLDPDPDPLTCLNPDLI